LSKVLECNKLKKKVIEVETSGKDKSVGDIYKSINEFWEDWNIGYNLPAFGLS